MPIFGTIVNGQVQLDSPVDLPDGSRVVVLTEGEAELDDFHPLPEPETYEEHIAKLKESIRLAQSGERGFSIEEVMALIDAELFENNPSQVP